MYPYVDFLGNSPRQYINVYSYFFFVQAKLEELLVSTTDSVLCDYVLVMVGNKKSSKQMATDLEARPFQHAHNWNPTAYFFPIHNLCLDTYDFEFTFDHRPFLARPNPRIL